MSQESHGVRQDKPPTANEERGFARKRSTGTKNVENFSDYRAFVDVSGGVMNMSKLNLDAEPEAHTGSNGTPTPPRNTLPVVQRHVARRIAHSPPDSKSDVALTGIQIQGAVESSDGSNLSSKRQQKSGRSRGAVSFRRARQRPSVEDNVSLRHGETTHGRAEDEDVIGRQHAATAAARAMISDIDRQVVDPLSPAVVSAESSVIETLAESKDSSQLEIDGSVLPLHDRVALRQLVPRTVEFEKKTGIKKRPHSGVRRKTGGICWWRNTWKVEKVEDLPQALRLVPEGATAEPCCHDRFREHSPVMGRAIDALQGLCDLEFLHTEKVVDKEVIHL
jgi:hypothetical protein